MQDFDLIQKFGHEQVTFFTDKSSGLKAIIAIHDTTFGPALGGCRMLPYGSDEEALMDVLRLSQGMTYKAVAAGLKLGGGKAVIIGDAKKQKSPALFRAFGRCVNTLGGRYITAEDVGTDVNDMEYVHGETPFVTGIDPGHGGSGNPAPFTAFGTLQGIKAAVEHKLGKGLAGVRVALQGLGSVGWQLAGLLKEEGAVLIVTDVDKDKLDRARKELRVEEVVSPDEIYSVNADVFAPCALGAGVNDETISKMKFKVIAGAANNQLKELRHGEELHKRGILYAPDYVVNAGGLINVYVELEGYNKERSMRLCRNIYTNTKQVFEISEREGVPTHAAADRMVEMRLAEMGKVTPRFSTYSREKFDKRR